MKVKKIGVFLCMLLVIALSITGFTEKKKIVVEAATATDSKGIEWEYSIMSVTGGSNYAYDVKPTSKVTGNVTVPSTLGGAPVQSIAEEAFSGCAELTYITLPSTVQTISDKAFYGCTGLKNISYNYSSKNALKYIGTSAFQNCSALTEINLKTVTTLGAKAFYGCTSIKEISLSSELGSVPLMAFYSCKSLKKVTINNQDINLNSWAFGYCSALEEVIMPEQITSMQLGTNVFYDCEMLRKFYIPCDVELGEGVFYSCYNLQEVVFEGKATIGARAFSYSQPTEEPVQLKITFMDDVVIDGYCSFSCNTGLRELDCRKNLTVSGVEDFGECSNLKRVTVNGDFETGGYHVFSSDSPIENFKFGGNISTTEKFPNLKSVTYTGNTTQIISAPSMEFSEKVSEISGTINTSVAKEVIFRNPSVNLSKVTVEGTGTSKSKIYALEGSTGEAWAKINSSDFDFFNIIASKDDLKVTMTNKEILLKPGESIPEITPELLGLTVQAKYYGQEDVVVVGHDDDNNTKGYQLILSELKVGENKIIVKYSGQEVALLFNITQEKLPATETVSTPPVTETVSTPPVTETVSTPPVTETVSTPPVTETVSTPPVTETVPTPPVTETVSTPPVTETVPTPPVTETVPTPLAPTITPTPEAPRISIKDGKITLKKNKFYVAYKKTVKPAVSVTYNNRKLIKNKDYAISYTNNKAYGKGTVTISGIGEYTGTVKKTFYILPEKTKITSCKNCIYRKQRVVELRWKKQKGIDGYQIVYSYSKKGKYKEIGKKRSSITSSVFAFPRKKVYIKIRAYVYMNGKIEYGAYSPAKKAR